MELQPSYLIIKHDTFPLEVLHPGDPESIFCLSWCRVLDSDSPFEAVRQRADVLASIRNGEYLFKRPEPNYEIALDLFRKTR